MRTLYVDLPASAYKEYYAKQVGGTLSLPYFAGGGQAGAGLSNIFGKMVRTIAPNVLASIKPRATRAAVNMGHHLLDDVVAGRNIGEALKHRGIGAAKQFVKGFFTGKRKRKTTKPQTHSRKKTRRQTAPALPAARARRQNKPQRRLERDIFH